LGKQLVLACIIIGLASLGSIQAEDANLDKHLVFDSMHQVGIRLGVWENQGGSPPQEDPLGTFETNFNDANFYFEGFFAYRLHSSAMVELSLGIVNRGSVTFIEGNATNIGHVLVHPILLQLKLYPFFSLTPRLHPYLVAGGGIYYGHRSVEFTRSSDPYFFNLNEQSGTNFSYVLGGGIDWPISTSVGLETNVKYMPINFSKGLQTIRDYDAIVFTIGVKYLYLPKK